MVSRFRKEPPILAFIVFGQTALGCYLVMKTSSITIRAAGGALCMAGVYAATSVRSRGRRVSRRSGIRQLLRMRLFHVGDAVPDDPPRSIALTLEFRKEIRLMGH